jgi:dethiobiotin synthetase
MAKACSGLFVTGTDTGVGKTYVAALIARSLAAQGKRVGVYKPAASGCLRDTQSELVSEDAVALWHAAGCPGELDRVCPQRFAAPLAPPLAARAEGREVDAGLLCSGLDYWRDRSDVIIVEGAGGLMSPLGQEGDVDLYVADLAADFGFPLVVVAANRLGTINATLQTLLTARSFRGGLSVAGVVVNHPSPAISEDLSRFSNGEELLRRCKSLCSVPLLATVAYRGGFDRPVEWEWLCIG